MLRHVLADARTLEGAPAEQSLKTRADLLPHRTTPATRTHNGAYTSETIQCLSRTTVAYHGGVIIVRKTLDEFHQKPKRSFFVHAHQHSRNDAIETLAVAQTWVV